MSHSHQHLPADAIRLSPLVRYLTLGLLALVAGATALGLYLLWPDYGEVAELAQSSGTVAEGVRYEQGEIMTIADDCSDAASGQGGAEIAGADPATGPQTACRLARVGVLTGPDSGRLVPAPMRGALASSGLQPGDRVQLVVYENADAGDEESGSAAYAVSAVYNVSGVIRHLPLLALAVLFALVVVAVGRLRGLLALVALAVSAGVLFLFVLPALVTGGPGLLIGVVGSSAIMFVILYLVHGPNLRTTAALIGTLAGILIIAGVSFVAVQTTRLSGIGDESAGLLSATVSGIDFRGLLTCSILIAGLGILNDVTITQASSVWELRAAAPELPRREIYARAMRIGRDHIASTVYTVFFAYVGAALSVLLLLYLYDRPLLSLLTGEDIAIEIVRTLCGSIGLVLAVPITTGIAALFVPAAEESHRATAETSGVSAVGGGEASAPPGAPGSGVLE